MAIQNWPKTNTSGDWASVDGIVWSENQAANTVNDSARAMGRDLAKWLGDTNATLTLGGTSTVYTLTSNGSFSSLANGFCVAVKANVSNTGAATLNVDSLGAKAIRKFSGSGEAALVANDMVAGGHYLLQYNTAANSAAGGWVLINPNQVATGDIADNAVTAAKLADNAVDTAAIAANNVTAAKIERNSNTGFVLRANGSGSDPSWVGGMTLLSSGTSSAAATLDLALTSGYRRYVLHVENCLPATDGAVPNFRVSINSGSTYEADASDYLWAGYYVTSTGANGAYASNTGGTTAVVLAPGGQENTAEFPGSYVFEIHSGSASQYPSVFFKSSLILSADGALSWFSGSARYTGSDAATNVRLLYSSGNIATASYALYGIA
jgi:hypothetical protein